MLMLQAAEKTSPVETCQERWCHYLGRHHYQGCHRLVDRRCCQVEGAHPQLVRRLGRRQEQPGRFCRVRLSHPWAAAQLYPAERWSIGPQLGGMETL